MQQWPMSVREVKARREEEVLSASTSTLGLEQHN